MVDPERTSPAGEDACHGGLHGGAGHQELRRLSRSTASPRRSAGLGFSPMNTKAAAAGMRTSACCHGRGPRRRRTGRAFALERDDVHAGADVELAGRTAPAPGARARRSGRRGRGTPTFSGEPRQVQAPSRAELPPPITTTSFGPRRRARRRRSRRSGRRTPMRPSSMPAARQGCCLCTSSRWATITAWEVQLLARRQRGQPGHREVALDGGDRYRWRKRVPPRTGAPGLPRTASGQASPPEMPSGNPG